MKRFFLWLAVGVLALSLAYLFKPRSEQDRSTSDIKPAAPLPEPHTAPQERININTASLEELKSLPGVGPVMAERIVEYRAKHGPFARPEDLLIIEGMGEKKFRALADFIRVE